MTAASGAAAAAGPASTAFSTSRLASVRWSLMFGNFVIGCGVMCVAGTLNDMAEELAVSVALAGQLITIAAATMCFGAPLLAGWVAGFDRRRLLALALVWYAAGHALSALMPSYALLWPVRALTMLAAAVFTPQAAAAIGFMTPPEHRGRAITFIFLGWSIASVVGLPLSQWVGETYGWRSAFFAIAAIAAIAAVWVYAALPDGVRPAALSLHAWKQVLTHPVLMAMVLITALFGAGQFTLFSYFAPYYRMMLHASTEQITALLICFGVFGLIGNLVLTRVIDRVGPSAAVTFTIALIAVSLILWPLGSSVLATGFVLVPWALGCFSSNSGQQARLSFAAPALAPALMALNTSAIYLGQAAGAASGGWLIAHAGYAPLNWAGLVWVVAAMLLSLWAARQKVVVPT
ncbi:MAG TPA: MFS transporter [Burkholderiaceae bacterium]|nr:MFS transporter [Burkholderiaceae bacterium]